MVLQEFQKVGILDDVVKAGYKNQEGLSFRTPGGGSDKLLASIPPGKLAKGSIDYGVQLGQHRLAEIFLQHAQKYPNFRIRYDTQFVDLYEEDNYVYITAASSSSSKHQQFVSQFVVACDGASSPVRKALDIPFEGFTWQDWRFLAINIKYDFEKHGYSAAQHIVDSDDWAVIARAGSREEGIWRIATGIDPSIPATEIEQHLPAKLERLLPGPRPLNYEIVAVNPYWAHERVASSYRLGRVVLCGDAAHVITPPPPPPLTRHLHYQYQMKPPSRRRKSIILTPTLHPLFKDQQSPHSSRPNHWPSRRCNPSSPPRSALYHPFRPLFFFFFFCRSLLGPKTGQIQ